MHSEFVGRVWRQRRYRLFVGIVGGALLGVLFAAGNQTLYELITILSPRPERYQETGNLLTFGWATVYFVGVFLLPVVTAYLIAGQGLTGWVGVIAYVAVWWHVAPAVGLGANALQFQRYGVVFLALYEVFKYGAGTMTSDTEPWMSEGVN